MCSTTPYVMLAEWPMDMLAADALAAEWPSNIQAAESRSARSHWSASKTNARIPNSVILHALR